MQETETSNARLKRHDTSRCGLGTSGPGEEKLSTSSACVVSYGKKRQKLLSTARARKEVTRSRHVLRVCGVGTPEPPSNHSTLA
ncbi:hypothetical protein NDU88_000363 [Pleurodeles waltl]|uniref:Uncharacterized protein n=1 Tax=Pleurodeles waltl TaxID=8319 RepID=A0AAV7L8D7_PLEWA|nr:hypothetical protein NDU88_000363 [Pleurodeles waltl]